MSITSLAIKRPTLIVVIFSVLALLGITSYFSIGYELLPKVTKSMITISTSYPGASPSEVESSVTKKIEDAISSLEKIDGIRSQSLEGSSNVIVEFKSTVNITEAMQDAQRKVDGIASKLPEDAKTPVISKFSVDEAPIMKLSIIALTDSRELFDVVKQRIVPLLSRVDGVANVGVLGGEERQVSVNIDRRKIDGYDLDLHQVLQAIESANVDFPAGAVKSSDQEITIRLAGKFKSADDIANVIVTSRDGRTIYLKDVATIIDGIRDTESISRYNANTAIGLLIYKQTDANAVEISEQVRAEMKLVEEKFKSSSLKFFVAQDSSEFTLQAAEAVSHDLMLAIILVALVMLVFLHSFRNAIIVMIAIPASLVTTFIAIQFFGYTFNLMTLLALSLVVGILVDDSIVVLENIERHLEMGKHKRKAALDGRKEIGFTALSITLVDVAVFLPICMVDGLIADILRQFSSVVVVSTLMSLFVSFTLTPLLVSRFGKLTHPNPGKIGGRMIIAIEKYIQRMGESYTQLLKWSLAHKRWVLSSTMLLLVGSFSLVKLGFIGNEFVNMGDRGELVVNLEMPKEATIQQTNLKTQEVEQYLLSKPFVVNVFSTIGKTDNQFSAQGSKDAAEISVKLIDKTRRPFSTEQFSQQIKKELQENIEGVKIKISNVDIMGSTSEAPIQLVLNGPEMDKLLKFADTVYQRMKTVPGSVDQKISIENNKPEVNVKVDKGKMHALGLTMAQVGSVLKLAFNGDKESKLLQGQYEYDINVKLDAFNRESVDELKQLTFKNAQHQTIRLDQFATIEKSIGPAMLERKDRISSVTVSSQVVGRPQGTVGAEIKATMDANQLPEGITVSYEGNMKQQAEAFGSLGYAFIASVIFVYLIMVALYNSYIYPFVVLFSIPVAMVGALLALALSMQSLNIFSFLGIIMLVGLVAKNAILLVDYTNQLKEKGHDVMTALLESGRTRLRPILMTTIAMVIGMLPLALAKGAGAEWKNGMAWALIGGLTSSMLLTLLVVPVVYLIIDRIKERFSTEKDPEEIVDPELNFS